MFKKKGDDKKEAAKKSDAPAAAGAAAGSVASSGLEAGTGAAGLASSQTSQAASGAQASPTSSASGLAAQEPLSAEGAQSGQKNPYKISIVTDVLLPVTLALGCCGAFCATVKIVPDKVSIYGVSKEISEAENVADKSLVSPQFPEEVAQSEPLKLLKKGDVAAALNAARTLAGKKGDDARSLYVAGVTMVQGGSKADKEKGVEYLAKAYELAPYSQFVLLEYARGLNAVNRDDDSIGMYEKLLRVFADKAGMAPKRELGDMYLKTNKSAEAVKTFTELMQIDAKDPSYQRKLGFALAQEGRQQDGFEEFRKGFTKEQDTLGYPYAVYDIVSAHAGLLESALADQEKVVAKNPNDLQALLALARLYIGTNKLKEARDTLEKARKLQELNPDLHEIMAEVMCRQNQSTSGFDEFRMAVNNMHLKD
ncbi:MAG: tetratricopeptide repeat protein [Candidatus Obscuribacterales bacterium]|nr:tetratricopeptide repeat protein [Candidatus Obscuribacterales bacterium]